MTNNSDAGEVSMLSEAQRGAEVAIVATADEVDAVGNQAPRVTSVRRRRWWSRNQVGYARALEDYIAKTGDESAKIRHTELMVESVDARTRRMLPGRRRRTRHCRTG